MAASQLLTSALLALCLVSAAVATRDIITDVDSQGSQTVPVAVYNEALHSFEFYNETVEAPRRKALGLGQSARVTVTFYNQPGMDCETGKPSALKAPTASSEQPASFSENFRLT